VKARIMLTKENRTSHIEVINRSLISIVAAICIFQIVSFGLVISRAVESYQQAGQLASLDQLNNELFIATDLLAREHSLSQSLLATRRSITAAEQSRLKTYRQQANRQWALALQRLSSSPGLSDPHAQQPILDQWQHFQHLRVELDQNLAQPQRDTGETLGYQLSLANASLMQSTDLLVHELTRKLASTQEESIGRLAQASYLLWHVRNQISEEGTALGVRAMQAHQLNTANEAQLDSRQQQANGFIQQLQMEMRFLSQFPLGYQASSLAQKIRYFHQLTSQQLAALGTGRASPLTAEAYIKQTGILQDDLLTRFSLLSSTEKKLIDRNTDDARNRLLRNILLLCVAIALNLALLVWLRRRVITPLKLLSTVHDAAREAILLINPSGQIFMANSGAELVFGCSNQQLCTLNLNQLLQDGDLDAEQLAALAEAGKEIRTTARLPAGRTFAISMIASPLATDQGNQGTLVIVRDDSERHQAEEDNRESLAMLANITRIQNLLFSQLSRHQVFSEILDALLTETRAQAGCLLEVDDTNQQSVYRYRASLGMEEPQPEDSESLAALYQNISQDPHWAVVRVALQNNRFGLLALNKPQNDPHSETLEPLLGLYAGVLGFVSEEEGRKQSTSQLQEVLHQQQALFSASPAGLIQIDQRARVVRTNEHASNIFSIAEADFIGLSLEQVLNDRSAWLSLEPGITRIRQGKPTAACELECRNHAGARLWLLFEIRPLYADRPQEAMILSCIDITTLKQTERALREARDKAAQAQGQLAAAIEAIPEAFAFYDEQDCLVVCNQHYADLFFLDLTSDQIIGKRFEDLARISVESGHEAIEPGFDTEGWIAERTHRHKQEQAPFPLQIGNSWYQVTDHQIAGLGCVCLRANITQLKMQEQELRQATIKADDANQAKSAFLASISHEIRTPLNGILGLLELLGLTSLDLSQKETLVSVQDSAQTLLRLIDDILDFSKIEAGRLDLAPEPTPIRSILKKVQSLYMETAMGKGLTFELEIDPRLSAAHLVDPLRLRQILQNFVSNAIKFTHQGQVLLSVSVQDQNPQQQTLRFACKDSGIGIPQESLGSLFRPFTQAESSTTRRFGGTGLGLAICKRLAEQMEGTVALESTQGQGTTASFIATFAISATDVTEGKQEEASTPGDQAPVIPAGALNTRGNAPILFVEDNPTNRKLTMMQLERIGVPCEVAENGQEAFDLWLKQPFSLVLTDCHMPIMDGHQLARAIREEEAREPGRPPVPIIACTANIGQDEANRALAAGMNQVLTKPIGLDALKNMLDTWLGSPGQIEETRHEVPPAEEHAEPVIDRSTLEIYSQGDLAVEIGILQDFLHSEEEDMQALQKAVNEQNAKDARWYTHRIKGAGRMVGAIPLANAAEALENQAKQEAPLQEAFAILQQAFRQVEDWISQQAQ